MLGLVVLLALLASCPRMNSRRAAAAPPPPKPTKRCMEIKNDRFVMIRCERMAGEVRP